MTMVHTVRKCPATLALYFGCIALCYTAFAQDAPDILDVYVLKNGVGEASHLSCSISPSEAEIEWLYNGQPVKLDERIKQKVEERLLQTRDLDGNPRKFKMSNLTIANATSSDDGNYTCLSKLGEKTTERVLIFDLSFRGKLIKSTPGSIKHNVSDQANVTMQCVFEVYKPEDVKWYKIVKDDEIVELLTKPPNRINIKQVMSSYDLHIRSAEDNGTYVCEMWDSVASLNVTGKINVTIFAPPQVVIDTVIPISSTQLYLKWTVRPYNSPIKFYNLMYRRLPSTDFSMYSTEKIHVTNTSFVMEGLEKSTEYRLKLEVTTMHGQSKPHVYESTVTTLDKDPIFVPNISINGFSATSVTIGWASPPTDIAELIHYYLLEVRKMDEVAPRRAYHSRDGRNLPYMFDNLEPHSTYLFRVCACSDYTKRCGNWSAELEAATLDGKPGKPSNVVV